jgi:NO-binding membrane sensor protein with MHYT domain/two-component sensor histidine kinase
MAGTHSYWLILLSVIVATMASFVGLDLGGRLERFRHHGMRSLWLVAGALSIGMGIWTMHFIGMLGFHLPIAVSYDIWITLLSLVMAIAGCGASLALVSSGSMGAGKLFGGGTLIGVAIVSMHYTGMAAMKLVPPIRYDPWVVILSIFIAVAASVLALWSAFELRFENFFSAFWKRAGSAVIQGSAIYGMHYTGMAAAAFAPGSRSTVYPPQLLDPTALAVILGAASLAFLLATLLISAYETLRASRLEPHVERLGRAVEHASEKVRALSSRLVELQDAERRRLAAELHDIVGQNLSALVIQLALIRSRLPAATEPELPKSLADATLLAKQCVEAVRKVMAQLRPPGLDELGLAAALRWHASAFESRTGIATKIDADESLPRPRAAVEDALLRIYLEALTNVGKHASAQAVRVKLELRNEHIRLSIADDGRGFDVQARMRGEVASWGLAIMQERAAAIDGELHIRSAPGRGTLVELSLSKDTWS